MYLAEDPHSLERRKRNAYFESGEVDPISPDCPRFVCVPVLPPTSDSRDKMRLKCSYEGNTLTTFSNLTLVHEMCHHTLLEGLAEGFSMQCKLHEIAVKQLRLHESQQDNHHKVYLSTVTTQSQ
jgi:hypothetical protein